MRDGGEFAPFKKFVGSVDLAGLRQGASSAQGATFRAKTSAAFRLTWLFVKLTPTHFSLQTAPLNKFAEPADRFLNRFAVANAHTNH